VITSIPCTPSEREGHTLPGLQNEGNAIPPLVLDVDGQSAESRASAVLGDGFIVQVAGLASIERFAVLSNDDILWLNGGDTTEYANLAAS
jgi:hypothetical protein